LQFSSVEIVSKGRNAASSLKSCHVATACHYRPACNFSLTRPNEERNIPGRHTRIRKAPRYFTFDVALLFWAALPHLPLTSCEACRRAVRPSRPKRKMPNSDKTGLSEYGSEPVRAKKPHSDKRAGLGSSNRRRRRQNNRPFPSTENAVDRRIR
jgi:hypothetical protein